MAMLIHERNMELEGMERKWNEQLKKEGETLRMIEREKEEFIGEVKRRQAQSEEEKKELLGCVKAVEEEGKASEVRLIAEFREKETKMVEEYRRQI